MNEKEKLTSEECIEKRLAEMLKEDMDKVPEVHITADQLEAWVKEDNAKRRKRFMKHAGIAAVFVLVCVTVLFAMWPGRTVPVGADKDKGIQVDKNDNAVLISGKDADRKKENPTIRIDDWDKIKKLKDEVNTLCVPEYYPKNFKFSKLEVELKKDNTFLASYYLSGKNNSQLQIEQNKFNSTGEIATYVEAKAKYIQTSKGKAVFYESDEMESKVTIAIYDSIVTITAINSNLTKSEYKNIIEGIKPIKELSL